MLEDIFLVFVNYYKSIFDLILLSDQADQRKAIMESFVAAQHYCLLAVCRRKYLLEYFGETCAYDKCGMILLKFN